MAALTVQNVLQKACMYVPVPGSHLSLVGLGFDSRQSSQNERQPKLWWRTWPLPPKTQNQYEYDTIVI